MVFDILRANRSRRPISLKGNPDNSYKRNQDGDYLCTMEEVRRMFADASIDNRPADSCILHGFTLEDIDRESLMQYRQRFVSINPTHPWLSLDDKDLLIKLGGYRISRTERREGLTLAGLLMFGRYNSIVDPDGCPAYFPDYKEYFSSHPEDRWTARIYPDGTWEANLFQFYIKVFQRLSAALPKPFTLQNGARIEDSPTHIALREAFVNALIHCDYSVNSHITVNLYKDRYTFSNPGSLLISISQYYQGGESVCRNKALQQMFMLIGFAEKAGSGIDKILQGWKQANFRKPQVVENANPDKVTLELPLVSLLSEEAILYLKTLFGNDITTIEPDKLLTLATCYSEGSVTNDRLQLVIDKHSTDITRLLKELCNAHYLIPSGIGRGTRYKINDEFRLYCVDEMVVGKTASVQTEQVYLVNQPNNVRYQIYNLIVENKRISRKELAHRVGIAQSAVQKHIAILINMGCIAKVGRTKGSYFKILKEFK